MLLQKLRERVAARLRNEESGFTLIELLVVMLIIGILAAIALPSFFNQRDKANDSEAKANAHTAQTAIETYATDNNGSYTGATVANLTTIEPTLGDIPAGDLTVTVAAGGDGYTLAVEAPNTGNVFTIQNTAGSMDYTCTTVNTGGCPADGTWD
jgi:type IV pilus assembly protein PilA